MTLATVFVVARTGEPGSLGETLASLARIDGGGDLDVVVVGAEPPPGAAGSTAKSLRDGLTRAPGEWITVIEAGERLLPSWIAAVRGAAGADILYGDSVRLDPGTGRADRAWLRPAWSPELLLGFPYLGRGTAVRRELAMQAGGFRDDLAGAEAYDLVLRAGNETAAIEHVPAILHAERDRRADDAALAAVRDVLAPGEKVEPAGRPGVQRVRREVSPSLTTIIIPTRDRLDLLAPCLESLRAHTTLPIEILVVDNDSRDPATLRYLRDAAIDVVPYPGEFHFSAMNNVAAAKARGRYVVFLNNDTVVHDGDWLPALLDHASQADVGAVGARLFHPAGTIQHVGIVLHPGARHDHPFSGRREDEIDHPYFPHAACEVSAVTGACLMARRDVFLDAGGFDPALRVAYNDLDLCLRLRRRGYRIVLTPFARLTHHECATRPPLPPLGDEVLFRARWTDATAGGDPYLGPVCRMLGSRLAFPAGPYARAVLDGEAAPAAGDDVPGRMG